MNFDDDEGSALEEVEEWSRGLKSRATPAYMNAYMKAYQRDQRTIKRLGLSVTVAEWRKTNGNG